MISGRRILRKSTYKIQCFERRITDISKSYNSMDRWPCYSYLQVVTDPKMSASVMICQSKLIVNLADAPGVSSEKF